MKSLEIVNSWCLDVHEKRLKLVSCGGNKEDIILSGQIDKLLRIRKDLEVLEIIRKKEVCLREVIHLCKGYLDMETALYIYNDIKDSKYHLTMEELLKLKQWLEVNENE